MRSRRICEALACLLALVSSGAVLGQDSPPAASPSPAPDPLIEKLTAYFRADAPRDRAALLPDIAALAGGDVPRVADALQHLPLWEAENAGESVLRVALLRRESKQVEEIAVRVTIPGGYDAATTYPLILVLTGDKPPADDPVESLQQLLGEDAKSFIIAVAPHLRGVWLSSPKETVADPQRALDALCRRYHIDTGRIYIYGAEHAGHAACVLAAISPDRFAGVVSIGGTLAMQLPPATTAELFLPNLRTVRSLWVSPAGEKESSVAYWNRYLADAARTTELPLDVKEHAADAKLADVLAPDALRAVFTTRRPAASRKLSLWFRYPAQGRIGWLRQTEFAGEPWTAQQLLVAPAPSEDAAMAATALLQEKLAYLGGEIEGQTIRITSRRCERIEIRLSSDLVDLTQPISIYVDGTKRFEGKVEPRIDTMLEIAREDWDFQRVWPVRLSISEKGHAAQQ